MHVGIPHDAIAPTTGSKPMMSKKKTSASETTKPTTLDFEIELAKTPIAVAAPARRNEPM